MVKWNKPIRNYGGFSRHSVQLILKIGPSSSLGLSMTKTPCVIRQLISPHSPIIVCIRLPNSLVPKEHQPHRLSDCRPVVSKKQTSLGKYPPTSSMRHAPTNRMPIIVAAKIPNINQVMEFGLLIEIYTCNPTHARNSA